MNFVEPVRKVVVCTDGEGCVGEGTSELDTGWLVDPSRLKGN